MYNLRTGTIRQREALVPRSQIWFRSAQSWLDDLPSVPKIQEAPAGG